MGTALVMVHPSENKSRRWKSPSTPDTSALSAARTRSSDIRSESGTARAARRRSPEGVDCFYPSCCCHEIDHSTIERNCGGVKACFKHGNGVVLSEKTRLFMI